MLKIGVIGVPGSGKSTLARTISGGCRSVEGLRNVELVNEYARRYISKHGPITSIWEQYRILEKQSEWEDSVCTDKLDLMVTDSPVFMGFLYCCALPKRDSKEIMFFNDVFKKMVKLNFPEPRYDIIFHLSPDIKPVDDGVRIDLHFDDEWRAENDRLLRSLMVIFKPKLFHVVKSVVLEDRLKECLSVLDRLKDEKLLKEEDL